MLPSGSVVAAPKARSSTLFNAISSSTLTHGDEIESRAARGRSAHFGDEAGLPATAQVHPALAVSAFGNVIGRAAARRLEPPPAYTLLPDTASAFTPPFIPEPSADQLLPFHLAMLLASTSPTRVKSPPM